MLVLSPTRELALQIEEETKKYKYKGIKWFVAGLLMRSCKSAEMLLESKYIVRVHTSVVLYSCMFAHTTVWWTIAATSQYVVGMYMYLHSCYMK